MMKNWLKIGWLTLGGLAWQTSGLSETQPALSQWLPKETIVAVEIAEPLALIEPLLGQDVAKNLSELPAWQKFEVSPQREGVSRFLGFLEAQLGTDWKSALRKLIGGGFGFAVGPSGETLLTLDAEEVRILEKLQETVAAVSRMGGRGPQTPGGDTHKGVTITSFGPKNANAVVGTRLMLANNRQGLERVLDMRAGEGGSLAASSSYQAARKAVSEGSIGTIFIDLDAIKRSPKAQQALAKSSEPLEALILTELRASMKQASWLAAGIQLKGDTLSLKIVTDGPAASANTFAYPAKNEEGRVWPNLVVPNQIASLSLYRDLHKFYIAKDELFPERTSGLVFFENMMGIFFSGIDLTEGVLAEAHPDIRVVVAAQAYDPAIGTPEVEIPAFAVVLRLRHPQTFGDIMEEAWQKAIGMASFTRGQKALPGFIIDRLQHGNTRISVASFRAPKKADKGGVDVRYNFQPSLARPGEYVILSSTADLAKQLVDAVKQEAAKPGKPIPATHSLAEIQGAGALESLSANREHIVLDSMVKKGKTRAKAEEEFDGLLTLLACIDKATLRLGQESGQAAARLDMKLKVPDIVQLKALHALGAETTAPDAIRPASK